MHNFRKITGKDATGMPESIREYELRKAAINNADIVIKKTGNLWTSLLAEGRNQSFYTGDKGIDFTPDKLIPILMAGGGKYSAMASPNYTFYPSRINLAVKMFKGTTLIKLTSFSGNDPKIKHENYYLTHTGTLNINFQGELNIAGEGFILLEIFNATGRGNVIASIYGVERRNQ